MCYYILRFPSVKKKIIIKIKELEQFQQIKDEKLAMKSFLEVN